MTLWSKFFGRRPSQAPRARTSSRRQASSSAAVRRELVRVALRDTLMRHGIPSNWMVADTQAMLDGRGDAHVYVRLQLRHCEPQLISHVLAFQNSLARRIALLDGTAASWLRGIAWNLSLSDPAVHPQMPPPSTWQRRPAEPLRADRGETGELEGAVLPAPVHQDQLERLRAAMAQGDTRHLDRSARHVDFQATQPFEDSRA